MKSNYVLLKIRQTMGLIVVILLSFTGTYLITRLSLENRLDFLNALNLLFLLGSIALICDISKLKWQLRKRDKRDNESKSASEQK